MSEQRIIVINPNSSETVTSGISAALDGLRLSGGPEIECLTLADGPPGIETQRHVDGVVDPLCRLIAANDNRAAAFVVACFSDPGLYSAREATAKPVFGIAESGIFAALTRGDRFGIISILSRSIPRHLRYVRSLGVIDRLAADQAIDIGVAGLADEEKTLGRMTDVGRDLRDRHGAGVLVMGCAGMARFRQPLESALGIPVIEPTQAAATLALGAVCLDQAVAQAHLPGAARGSLT
ncbi:MAG: aspartate/glutamate racemase family protein [Alphaproteobacteria bacterium]